MVFQYRVWKVNNVIISHSSISFLLYIPFYHTICVKIVTAKSSLMSAHLPVSLDSSRSFLIIHSSHYCVLAVFLFHFQYCLLHTAFPLLVTFLSFVIFLLLGYIGEEVKLFAYIFIYGITFSDYTICRYSYPANKKILSTTRSITVSAALVIALEEAEYFVRFAVPCACFGTGLP